MNLLILSGKCLRYLLGNLNAVARIIQQDIHDMVNLLCGLSGLIRQCPDLLRDHSESLTVLACPGSLDARIKGQKVGLACNI